MTLHGTGIHPGGITERFPLMVSALSGLDHPRAGRGVLRHPHLRRARRRSATGCCSARRPRRRRTSIMADALGRRVPPVGVDGRRRARLRPRPRAAHHPRDGGGHRADRLAHRADRARPGRRPALPLGGHRRRRARGDRGGQLVHGRRAPRPGVDLRARGRALRGGGHRRPVAASRPSKKLHPREHRGRPGAQPRASWPRPCTA